MRSREPQTQLLQAGVLNWTIRKEVNSLRHLYRYLKKHGKVERNPVAEVELPPEPEPRDVWLDADELRKVHAVCPPWLQPIVLIAAFTGMRLGEILKLRRRDIDLINGRASLPKTKNRKPRRVFLNKSAAAVLASLNLAGKGNDDLLFPGITQNRVSTQYRRCVKLSGVKDHRFHDLRHTAASHLHEEGLDDHTIAGLLGQKSIKTSRGYQHMSAKFLEQAAMRLDDRLGEVLSPGSHPQATKPD